MKYGAMIVGILAGFFSLTYIGLFGSMFGGLMAWVAPQAHLGGFTGEQIKAIAIGLPILAIVGGAICGANPQVGGVILLASAAGEWWLLGLSSVSEVFIFSTGVAGLLGIMSPHTSQTVHASSPRPSSGSADSRPDVTLPLEPRPDFSAAARSAGKSLAALKEANGARLVAAVTDVAIVSCVGWLVWPTRVLPGLYFYLFLAAFTFVYKALLDGSPYQGSIGKLATGLKVEQIDGSEVSPRIAALRSWPAALLFVGLAMDAYRMDALYGDYAQYAATNDHSVAYAFTAISIIAFSFCAFTSRRQGLHDLMAGTVVSRRAPMSVEGTNDIEAAISSNEQATTVPAVDAVGDT